MAGPEKSAIRYKVAEAARLTGVSASTLRLWELQGLIEPDRTEGGQRTYTDRHLEQLKRIQWQRAEQGLNPAAIKAGLDQDASGSVEWHEFMNYMMLENMTLSSMKQDHFEYIQSELDDPPIVQTRNTVGAASTLTDG